MSTNVLRTEDRLDGTSNFSAWKERIEFLLVVNDVWELASTTITPLIDATKIEEHNKKDAKARLLILDGVRDHIIPHILGKKIAREMWEALKKLYQSDN